MPIFSITFGDNKINVHTEELFARAKEIPGFLRGPTAEPGCGDFCFVWEGGIDALLDLLAAQGVDAIEGPVPRIGGRGAGTGQGISVYTRDPDDNLLEFISYDADDVARYSGSA
jgi:catechol 2,3-dioxygenase-like lactoylglutathione lyase family enzyme